MQLSVEKLVYGGDGLARLPADERGRGKAVFVPFVLPGERVEAALVEQKPEFARARAGQILEPSPQRVEPLCPYFRNCGGCHYQHARYEHQLEIKAAILKENLRRIAKVELDTELKVHASPAWHYRNRTRLKVRPEPEFALGYYKLNSHELLAVEQCPISSPLINRAIAALWELGRTGKVANGIEEVELFANADDTQLLIQGYWGGEMGKQPAKKWAQEMQAALPQAAGVTMFEARPANTAAEGTSGAERITASGAAELTYRTEHASYRVSAGAFFQVNRHLTDALLSLVTAGRSAHTVLDLYAGVGLFSAVLSREFARVIAVESSPTSHTDLLYNSPPNVEAVRATVEQYLKNVASELQPDLVVVDPPRSGLGKRVIQDLVTMRAPRITYVSCDPATLSRDLGGLLKSGYRVEEAHLVDLFPQTYHLESVFHLVR